MSQSKYFFLWFLEENVLDKNYNMKGDK